PHQCLPASRALPLCRDYQLLNSYTPAPPNPPRLPCASHQPAPGSPSMERETGLEPATFSLGSGRWGTEDGAVGGGWCRFWVVSAGEGVAVSIGSRRLTGAASGDEVAAGVSRKSTSRARAHAYGWKERWQPTVCDRHAGILVRMQGSGVRAGSEGTQR